MKNYLIVCALLLIIFNKAIGQVSTSNRVEIELEDKRKEYEIIPVEEKGVLIFSEAEEGSKKTKQIDWNFALYNNNFEKEWAKSFSINSDFKFLSKCYSAPYLYMIFSKWKDPNMELVRLNMASSEFDKFIITTPKKFDFSKFDVINNSAYFEGFLKKNDLVGHYDLVSKSFKILPSAFEGKTELLEFTINKKSEEADFVYLIENKKQKYINIKSFKEGAASNDIRIKSANENELLTAKMNSVENGNKVIIGTYSTNRFAQGIYFSKIVNNEQKILNYYSFTDFKNFFNYLSDKKKGKIEKKIDRKKDKGKDLELDYRLLVHDLIESKDHYTLVAEAYYPTYRSESYTTAGPNGRPVTQTRMVFDGWQYTHAVIAGFDKDGKLLWDNCFVLGDFKTFQLRKKVSVNVNGPLIKLAYGTNNAIRTQTFSGNSIVDQKELKDLKTNFEADKLKWSTFNLDYWYGNYFINWGNQKIKNSDDSKVKGKRIVFYFNKLDYTSF